MPKDLTKDAYEQLAVEVKFQNPDSGFIKGLAATYGGQPDAEGDVIAPGAMTSSLNNIKASGKRLKMLLQHDPGQAIGLWVSLKETRDGLQVEGKLSLDADDARNAYAKLKDGTLDALSIGYRTLSAEPRPGGGRTLTEIEIVEISVVTFPANAGAVVTDVKGADASQPKAQKAATKGPMTWHLIPRPNWTLK